MTWPEGRDAPMRLAGRARDIVTHDPAAPPLVVAEDGVEARLLDRAIVAISADPPRPALATLIGERAGGHLRRALATTVPGERAAGTPLYLLLDDMAGASLVAGWLWSQWDPDWVRQMRARMRGGAGMAGVCIGHAPGASSLDPARFADDAPPLPGPPPAVPLPRADDPAGWHAMAEPAGAAMRRARWIDVAVDKRIRIHAAFQDSATLPGGGRGALHEYSIRATADPATRRLLDVTAEPHVLPFAECPAAADAIGRLAGTPLAGLRDAVLAALPGVAGCTHLNDALRALAEVPMLIDHLDRGSKP